MAITNRVRIIVADQELDYKDASDLGVKFNRIAFDTQDISKRYGDFSYSFEVPVTKNNSKIFNYANAHGRKNIFKNNQTLPCKVYNNDGLLLDGVISLKRVNENNFSCVLYSKLKEFVDAVGEKTLRDLEFDEITFDYEKTIIEHINAGYENSDQTIWQFPFIYYGTYYTPYATYSGKTDYEGIEFDAETYPWQQYYYCMNTVYQREDNRFYHHQFPPAFYLVRVIEQIFEDAGWSLGGQFFNNDNIKKIVMTFAGEQDIYDQATGVVSGSTAVQLQPAKLLPDMKQIDLIKEVTKTFNLFSKVDVDNRIIKFSPFDVFFKDTFNPYDVTNKVFKETVNFLYEENNDFSLTFDDAENMKVMGDNHIMSGYTTNATDTVWHKVGDKNIKSFFNRIGTTDQISVGFSAPTIKRTFIYNDENVSGSQLQSGYHVFYQPLMSSQTTEDNSNMKFNKDSGHTYVFNNETTIKYGGKPSLHYYYGQSAAQLINKTGKGYASSYYYNNIFTGLTTQNRVKIGVCSPMQYNTYRDKIEDLLDNITDPESKDVIACSYLQSLYQILGTQAEATDYSLVFDDSEYHETLYSKFYYNMIQRLQTSEILEATMRMNDYDWNEMQIDRPIKYNDEIYHIIEISGYDPIKRLATIKLIKA